MHQLGERAAASAVCQVHIQARAAGVRRRGHRAHADDDERRSAHVISGQPDHTRPVPREAHRPLCPARRGEPLSEGHRSVARHQASQQSRTSLPQRLHGSQERRHRIPNRALRRPGALQCRGLPREEPRLLAQQHLLCCQK